MADIPLLTTDYFTKPEPVGSVSNTVARLMAEAGKALSERVEKQSQLAEAKLKSPALSQLWGEGYAKIASGNFSGFEDMARATGLSAGNPLLMGLAKEANDLGTSLANNYTQHEILRDRIKTQKEMADYRFAQQGGLQEDRQIDQEALQIDRDNAAIRKRNEVRKRNADEESKLSGKEVKPEVEDEIPYPVRKTPRHRASPLGLPIVEPDGSLPSLDGGAGSGGGGGMGASDADVEAARVKGPTSTDADLTKIREAEAADAAKWDTISLGDAQIKVGKGKDTMDLTGVDFSTTGSTRKYKPEDKTSRDQFIDAIGSLNSDPPAANFVAKYLQPAGKGVKFEEIDDGKKSSSRSRMFGIDKDGKEVPYDPTQVETKNKDGKMETTTEAGIVSSKFHAAYDQAIKLKDKVKNKFGIEFVPVKAGKSSEDDLGKKRESLSPEVRKLYDALKADKSIPLEEKIRRVNQATENEEKAKTRKTTAKGIEKRADEIADEFGIDTSGQTVAKDKAAQTEADKERVKQKVFSVKRDIESARGHIQAAIDSAKKRGVDPAKDSRVRSKILILANLEKDLKDLQ